MSGQCGWVAAWGLLFWCRAGTGEWGPRHTGGVCRALAGTVQFFLISFFLVGFLEPPCRLHRRRTASTPVPAGASFGDYVWVDVDGDGVQDPSETGLPGVTVLLLRCDGTLVQSTTTDANGRYGFSGLPAGSYRLVFVAPAGTSYTVSPASQGGDGTRDSDIDASGATACITVSDGESRSNIDAGFVPGVCTPSCRSVPGQRAATEICPSIRFLILDRQRSRGACFMVWKGAGSRRGSVGRARGFGGS